MKYLRGIIKMSANHNRIDGFIYSHKELSELDKTLLYTNFDNQITYDLVDIKKEQNEIKLLKRSSLIKTILFPLEYILTYFLMDKEFVRDRITCQKLYWKFLRNKISNNEFKRQLTESYKNLKK